MQGKCRCRTHAALMTIQTAVVCGHSFPKCVALTPCMRAPRLSVVLTACKRTREMTRTSRYCIALISLLVEYNRRMAILTAPSCAKACKQSRHQADTYWCSLFYKVSVSGDVEKREIWGWWSMFTLCYFCYACKNRWGSRRVAWDINESWEFCLVFRFFIQTHCMHQNEWTRGPWFRAHPSSFTLCVNWKKERKKMGERMSKQPKIM